MNLIYDGKQFHKEEAVAVRSVGNMALNQTVEGGVYELPSWISKGTCIRFDTGDRFDAKDKQRKDHDETDAYDFVVPRFMGRGELETRCSDAYKQAEERISQSHSEAIAEFRDGFVERIKEHYKTVLDKEIGGRKEFIQAVRWFESNHERIREEILEYGLSDKDYEDCLRSHAGIVSYWDNVKDNRAKRTVEAAKRRQLPVKKDATSEPVLVKPVRESEEIGHTPEPVLVEPLGDCEVIGPTPGAIIADYKRQIVQPGLDLRAFELHNLEFLEAREASRAR